MTIKLSRHAKKFLLTLPPKQGGQLKRKILALSDNPTPQDAKQLKGYASYLRADVGEYRIIYKTEQSTLLIALVGKRNDDDIYKKARRLLK